MAVERAQQAIDKLATERERFVAWERSVPADDWSKLSPGGIWQARDYIAHLASIDPLLVGIVRGFQREDGPGDNRGSERSFDIDEWNEGKILERRSRSIEELISEMAACRVDLVAAFEDFTNEHLDRTFRFRGDSKRSPRDTTVAEFLRGLVYHDRWHMEDARRAMEGEAEQPFGDRVAGKTMQNNPSVTA